MCFEEGRVVYNGGQKSREAPQQQGGEELGDDWVLQQGREEITCYTVHPALVPVTGRVAFADTKAPALTATAPCPGSAPPSQSG